MAKPKLICTIPGCGKWRTSHGLCNMHWYFTQRYSDPFGGGTRRGTALRWIKEHVQHNADACLLWPFTRTSRGRAAGIRYKGRRTVATRVMCEERHGPPPTPKHEAAHSCGKGHEGCINPKHLRWATTRENTDDREIHGTIVMGVDCYNAFLDEDRVRYIRRLYAGGMGGTAIADMFGLRQQHVWKIVNRKLWKHVE